MLHGWIITVYPTNFCGCCAVEQRLIDRSIRCALVLITSGAPSVTIFIIAAIKSAVDIVYKYREPRLRRFRASVSGLSWCDLLDTASWINAKRSFSQLHHRTISWVGNLRRCYQGRTVTYGIHYHCKFVLDCYGFTMDLRFQHRPVHNTMKAMGAHRMMFIIWTYLARSLYLECSHI